MFFLRPDLAGDLATGHWSLWLSGLAPGARGSHKPPGQRWQSAGHVACTILANNLGKMYTQYVTMTYYTILHTDIANYSIL